MLQHVQFLHGQQYFPSRKVELGCELIKRCYDELPDGYSELFSIDLLKEKGIVREGDLAVVTAGVLSHSRRHEPATSTNIMRVVNVD